MEEEHPDITASDFFSLGAQLPDLEILKAYARYFSRSRFGKITDVITRASINTYMSQLFAIIRPKAVTHSEDLTSLLELLYEREYLDTFSDMRMVLNLTLYMCVTRASV
ncbi:hypothetical protein F4680DRAFT_436697 [Xylaria scruposa]|nr:hypothetical protein F4680DRAFT_436697 [Xylaria scruposa]